MDFVACNQFVNFPQFSRNGTFVATDSAASFGSGPFVHMISIVLVIDWFGCHTSLSDVAMATGL